MTKKRDLVAPQCVRLHAVRGEGDTSDLLGAHSAPLAPGRGHPPSNSNAKGRKNYVDYEQQFRWHLLIYLYDCLRNDCVFPFF